MRSLLALALALPWLALAAPRPTPQAQAAFDRAEKALESGQLDEAVKLYQESLAATPGWANALNGLGSAYFRQNKRDEAISQFRAATQADPSYKVAWFNLGFSSRKLNDFTTAADAYERYTKLDPKDPDGFYGLGESYKALGDSAKGIAAYSEYVKLEQRASEQKWVEKAKESIRALQEKAAAAPAPATSPAPTAAAPATGGAAPTSDGQYVSAAQKKIAEGDKLMGEKKFREASFAYQDAINADGNNVEGLFKLGNSYAVLGYYGQAIERWTRVAQLSKDEGIKKSAQDNIEKAKAKMAKEGASPQAANKAPGSGPVADSTRQQARAWYEQGVKQIGSREYGNALASLSACLQLEPALPQGYVARGSALIGLRRYAEAAVDYQYALKLDPALSSPLYGLAESYRGLNRIGEARTFYERYVASSSPDVRSELQNDARAKIEQLKGAL